MKDKITNRLSDGWIATPVLRWHIYYETDFLHEITVKKRVLEQKHIHMTSNVEIWEEVPVFDETE